MQRLIAWLAAFMLLAAGGAITSAADKPPAQFKTSGAFTGGQLHDGVTLDGVRFGNHKGYTRMVLDLGGAKAHPVYSIEYREFPYRLIVSLEGTDFTPEAQITQKPALPFSVVTHPDGSIKEMQIFLPGPHEFKVIEIDDPAKFSIDVRPVEKNIPTVYTVQLTESMTASQAFALKESGNLPNGFNPEVLVMGDVVVVEQVVGNPADAAQLEAALREAGYNAIINERRGNELPQR